MNDDREKPIRSYDNRNQEGIQTNDIDETEDDFDSNTGEPSFEWGDLD